MLSRCAVWMFAAVLGSTACGGTEEEAPVPEAENEVTQSVFYAGCQVDSWGIQTGTCFALDYSTYQCMSYSSTGCKIGVLSYSSATYTYTCGTRVNDNPCNGKYGGGRVE